jgi:hypothetical protein
MNYGLSLPLLKHRLALVKAWFVTYFTFSADFDAARFIPGETAGFANFLKT